MLRALVLPVNANDPPTTLIVEQLNAVDSAHERFRIIGIVARLVCTPHMRDSPEPLNTMRDLRFVKASFLLKWFCPGYVTFDIQYLWLKIDIVSSGDARGRN